MNTVTSLAQEPTMTQQAVLQVKDLHKTYNGNQVLKGVEFDITKGQVKAVLGPSGSGKSTMLRLMALLEPADSGEILLKGSRIGSREHKGKVLHLPERALAIQRQEVGMVFQRFNLFPHLSAVRNVMLGLTSVRASRTMRPGPRHGKCCKRWAWTTVPTITPRNCPAGSSSVWRLPAPWS